MGLRFQKRLRVSPGIRLNASMGGVSTSIGTRGAWLTFGRRGIRSTVGIPSTGISYSTVLRDRSQRSRPGGLLYTEVLAISVATGWQLHSWWWFGGLLFGFMIALSVRSLQMLLMLVLSGGWAYLGYFLGTPDHPGSGQPLSVNGLLWAGGVFVFALLCHRVSLQRHRDNLGINRAAPALETEPEISELANAEPSNLTQKRAVSMRGERLEVSVHRESTRVWRAVGYCGPELIRSTGRSEEDALERWQESVRVRNGGAE